MKTLVLVLLLLVVAWIPASGQPQPGGPPPEQTVISAATSGTPAVGQISVASTATLIKAATATRSTIVLVNHGSTNVFIGFTTGVTTSGATGGAMLVGIPGSTLTFQTRSAIYGIAATGTQIVGFYEEIR
jgi:hypothetical protein